MDRRGFLGGMAGAVVARVMPHSASKQPGGDLRVVFEDDGTMQNIIATLDGKPLPLNHIDIEYVVQGVDVPTGSPFAIF